MIYKRGCDKKGPDGTCSLHMQLRGQENPGCRVSGAWPGRVQTRRTDDYGATHGEDFAGCAADVTGAKGASAPVTGQRVPSEKMKAHSLRIPDGKTGISIRGVQSLDLEFNGKITIAVTSEEPEQVVGGFKSEPTDDEINSLKRL